MASKNRRGMRKVPLFVETRLGSLGDNFRIAVVQRINVADVSAGLYAHLGMKWQDGSMTTAGPLVPDASAGRYAQRNVEGQVVARHDLPKIEKTITFINRRPFGRYGPCRVTQTRLVLQREHVLGPRHTLEAVVLRQEDESYIVRFGLVEIFSALVPEIDRKLLFALNLLQEAVGGINVFPPDASTQDYLDTVQVKWFILPPGERESNIRLLLSSYRPKTAIAREELERKANERYDLFQSLSPRHLIRGDGGMSGYLGALIADDLVVFEHLNAGNATYILFGDWAIQSQRTKTDLLRNGLEGKDYIRVIHSGEWQSHVRDVVGAGCNSNKRGRHSRPPVRSENQKRKTQCQTTLQVSMDVTVI